MIRSMTGFGRGTFANDEREYIVEIKSVNHKYADVNIRMPYVLSFLEDKIKKHILEKVARGKIDVNIMFNNNSNIGKKVTLNQEMAKVYISELKKMAEENNIIDDISIMKVSRLPDVLNVVQDDNTDLFWNELVIAIDEALIGFIQTKEKEGSKLAEDMQIRLDNVFQNISKISEYSSGLIEQYVVKLRDRIKEMLQTDIVDEARIAQEVVIYADKTSIEEEVTRLKSHIAQFKELLNTKDIVKVGKKLDFIIQEMNRETNTIGSKANCLEITNLVIEIKTELEDIREQVQNIE